MMFLSALLPQRMLAAPAVETKEVLPFLLIVHHPCVLLVGVDGILLYAYHSLFLQDAHRQS